ncbi:uncharacterized protein LOC110717802 isoform X3 [Chenopodium quinoa]|uniref:uncharacterized protein LOC110717802 isoform X3 n=1 Tax=Chenopodium quinoa TaxID=63459 RepID=UPI000B7713FC|nr:uncharacterized protein LOC110717802 isoform X3 [Chenopodium quinoa]
MANPGVGNRFTSVNLNKSYGQSLHSNQSNSSNYGLGRGNRSSGGGGGGGGMVVLSRPRSSHKVGSKLSVPPPLNLPSLRREHEKFDSLGSGSGSAGGGVAGSGARPSSSGMGWSKPSAIGGSEREGAGDRPLSSEGNHGVQNVDGVNSGGVSTAYMPPSARTDVSVTMMSAVEKANVLKGEDFPSLRATLSAANVPSQKQKDSAHQKHRQGMSEQSTGEQREGLNLNSHVDMRPQVQSSHLSAGNGLGVNIREDRSSANFRSQEKGRKQDDYFPGPLLLVRLSPRSDWADDERDTSHGLTERSRDLGFSRTEAYWDRDFDLPRSSLPPHKPAQNHFDRRGQRDNDVGKGLPNEVSNADSFNKNSRVPSREGHEGQSWRTPVSRDRFGSQEGLNDRNNFGARPASVNHESNKDNKYFPPQRGSIRDEYNVGQTANRDYAAGRRDHGRQQWNNSSDLNNGRKPERDTRDSYANNSNRYKAEVQSNMGLRSSFSSGNKGLSVSDHIQNFGRDKRSTSRNEKPYVEDPFSGFDGQDPFPGVLGAVKRKKDANKPLNFHDPVRESFEAELERVQQIQEQERQRIIEEQERALEMARREEEERQRVAREQEEHQRRLVEEAREAAWRSEQERLESIRRAEEQRIAREDEKQRMMMEEDRRKQAAKQKLLELEERIARRQAETAKVSSSAAIPDDMMPVVAKDRDVRADDFSCWEDGERMVERITNSASSDSSLSRPFDMGSRAVAARESSFAFTDRGKPFNSWRRDMLENGNSSSFFSADPENGHQSPRRDFSVGGKSFPRKDLYGGQGYMPTRGYYRGGIPEPLMDDFPHPRGQRWNISGDGDPYGRNTDLEADFPDNVADRFDLGWGQGRGRGNSPFPERFYQNSDLDDLCNYGRSRYPARQPRVLPPPSLPSVHQTSFRGESEHPDSSAYEDGNIQLNQASRSESAGVSYQDAHKEHSEILDVAEQSSINGEQELNRSTTPGRDSQSSLSVSSPPSSPTHLSHDDLDESRESLAVHCRAESQDISLSENEDLLLKAKMVKGNTIASASSVSVGDDEEWTIDNNEELPEQEEYDEDVGYHEEDVHEGDDENVELNHEFEDMHLEGKDSPHMDNMVLGFDQGVEVGIPNEDYDKSPKTDESLYTGPQAAVSILEQKESADGSRDGQSAQVADVSQLLSIDGSCVIVQESEKNLDPTNVSMSLDSLNTGVSTSGTVLSAQQSVSSPVMTNSLSSNQTLPGVAATKGPADLPVKLQFGLFSGPSLIPSPVPAIQIGSIQMPLQLHPQMGPSLTHMHAPQPPLFQFGQLRYPTPMSQGILPLAPQSMSFVQPNFTPSYTTSQVPGGPPASKPVQDSSHSSVKSHQVQLPHQLNAHQRSDFKESNLLVTPGLGTNVPLCQNKENSSSMGQIRPDLGQQADSLGRPCNVGRNPKPLLNNRASESRVGPSSSHSAVNVKDSSGPSAQGQFSGSRGRRFAFTARHPGPRSSSSANEASRSDIHGFQRKPWRGPQRFEFRVRQPADGKQSSVLSSSSFPGPDAKLNSDGKNTETQPKSGLKKELRSDKPKQTLDSEISGSDQIQVSGSGIEEDKTALKEAAATSGLDTSHRAEGSLKRNIGSEDDVDAPLQSGIVRVFKQSGIEAPSDEDDFIEVRSKRQMLNDRREQREKDFKAKSSNMRKAQRKSRPAAQGTATTRSTSRATAPLNAQATKNVRSAIASKRGLLINDVSATLKNVGSQPLAPIGTPPVGADCQIEDKSQTVKPPQTNSYANHVQTVGSDAPDLTFDSQGKAVDGVQSSIGSWGSPSINQPTQLEEAMKPAHFDTHVVSIGDCGSSVNDSGLPSSSVLAKDNTFSSATSPINSLLAGEKIQFGAVTSPTILPPSTRVSHNIRSPASLPMNVQRPQSMPASQNHCDVLFEKEKHPNELCSPLEDCEAEAEAAASAVAVAAIGNDEVVGNGIGSCSTTMSDPKSFGGADINRITTDFIGMSGDQHAVSQSKSDETLSVSLPADLSVETPPISIWPPLPSPHSSSSHMLSPFPGGPTSHFPYYDMNPMMRGPVFAFGPHEESAALQPQPQKSSVSSSGPLGTWQHCHTGVDSFYGPPAGFTAPFISPPGSIPGVQGPPHMVVYNHFAPVGQFGQVGLSYMGTTYIPSGKQPDWKHNSSPALVGSEGEVNNTNLVPVQRSAPNVPAQAQHLAPGSPLLSMASPLAMFEVSPFQSSSPDVSVHPRWSHVQSSPIHTMPQSMALQQQAEGVMPSQSSHASADHHSLNASGFSKTQTSSSLEDGRSFSMSTNAAASQFPNELGLVNPPVSIGSEALALHMGSNSRSGDPVKVDACAEGSGSQRNPHVGASAPNKAQAQMSKQKNPSAQQQYNHYQRGGGQKNSSGAEWSSRKMGFHGRNHSSGGERGFPPTKVKQIYVAKQNNTSGTGTGTAQ